MRRIVCLSVTAFLLGAPLLAPTAQALPCPIDLDVPQLDCRPATETHTQPSREHVALGDAVNDTALVTPADAAVPGPVNGTVQFYLCSPAYADCVVGDPLGSPVTLVNGLATSIDVTPPAPGFYCFRAVYSGEAAGRSTNGWKPSEDTDGLKECVDVGAVTKTESRPAATTVSLGTSVSDHAWVNSTNSSFPGPVQGGVDFFVCGPVAPACGTGGTPLGGELLANGHATSDPFIPTVAGTYCFRASYLGVPGVWAASQDASRAECFTVVTPRNATTTVSHPSANPVGVGKPVHDEANVTGTSLAPPTGTVAFFVCAAGVVPCATGGTPLGTSPVGGAVNATSSDFIPTAPGTYCFRAEYSGDNDNAPSMDASRSECFTVSTDVPFFPSVGALAMGLLGSVAVVGGAIYWRRR